MVRNSPEQLRLLAQDVDDLAVFSAHMQDAVVRLGDIAWLPAQRRFALVASRFDWLSAEGRRMERRHTGMHFDNVLKVTHIGIDQSRPDLILNLLGILFTPTTPPAGEITLTFSGGGTIRLEVECVEAQLRDMGTRWKTRRRPGHTADAADVKLTEQN